MPFSEGFEEVMSRSGKRYFRCHAAIACAMESSCASVHGAVPSPCVSIASSRPLPCPFAHAMRSSATYRSVSPSSAMWRWEDACAFGFENQPNCDRAERDPVADAGGRERG